MLTSSEIRHIEKAYVIDLGQSQWDSVRICKLDKHNQINK